MAKFDITKVLILVDRPDLCRMVVTWPNVDHALTGNDLVADWALLSCVAASAVRVNREILIRLGIIKPKGEVEKTAVALAQKIALEAIQGREKRKRVGA